jgi:type II secretory pathway pseudopilin PulG
MAKVSTVRRARPSEEGYILVAVVFMTAILVLSLAVALPRVRESIQRDREIETMHRGKQYIRAIQLYYKKFNSYPPNLDALIKTNNIRFLRKKYIDPTTGKEEWKPIMYGQNKTPAAMGFFGQPLAVSSLAGIGPSGGNLNQGSQIVTGGSTTQTGGGLFNSTPTTGGSTDAGTGAPGSPGTGGSAPGGTNPIGNPIPGGTGSNGNPITGGGGGAGGAGAGGAGAGGAGAGDGTSTGADGSSSAFGGPGTSGGSTNGQTFGGGGIIGFSPQSPRQSILVYKKKNHYNEWEFLYSPAQDQQMQGGGNTGAIGQPASSTTTPVGTQPFAPTTPTTPQQ